MNPFISFCLYVAARVFVQYLKSRPDDSQTADSLRFLLSAMSALKRRNPLTESFLVQLDVDLEALGMRIPKLRSAFPRSGDSVSLTNTQSSFETSANAHAQPDLAAGKRCDDPDGVAGILSYRNEFSKAPEEGVNAAAPEIVEPDQEVPANSGSTSRAYGGSGWDPTDPSLPHEHNAGTGSLPMQGVMLTPASASLYEKGVSRNGHIASFGQSESGGDNNTTSPEGDQSNRPTPNSSSASEQRGANQTAGMESFDSNQRLDHQNTHARPNTEAGGPPFYGDTQNYPMGTSGMAPAQRFPMGESAVDSYDISSNNWQGMPSQGGMTPMAEGVLRSLMNMGPMDALDLSTWNSTN